MKLRDQVEELKQRIAELELELEEKNDALRRRKVRSQGRCSCGARCVSFTDKVD